VLKFVLRLFVLKVLWDRWRADPKVPGNRAQAPARPGPSPRSVATTQSSSAAGPDNIPAQKKGEPGPDTPLELTGGDWKVTVRRTLKEIKADRVPFIAAAMAYYFFLAIFPALIAFIGILGLADADPSGVIDSIESTLPGDSGQALTEAIREANNASRGTSLTSAILGIAVALWSASSGMAALQTGLNVAYDVPEDRKFIRKRAVALVLLIATGLFGGVPSPLFTFGESTIFVVLGWILTVVAVTILFSIYYYIGPKREQPTWHWVSAGGIVGAVLWIVVSVGFGFFVENYSNYSKTYGSLAGVIVLILLLYLTSLSVLIGGELNAELERRGEERTQSELAPA
jgi:membrane protein